MTPSHPLAIRILTSSLALVLPVTLLACADPEIEDPVDDVFYTEESKADAFGVEDWSPDGAAVLRLVSNATETKLKSDVGLSTRVARGIVRARTTLADGAFTDLRQLDQVPYVGKAVFARLLAYAADKHLFKTALRIPLVLSEGTALTTYNDEARAAGRQAFARYTFVSADTDYGAKAAAYEARLTELGLSDELMRYASSLSDYSVGTLEPCYIGDPEEVPGIPAALTDDMMSDMYSQWGWRYREASWQYFEDEPIEDATWQGWDTGRDEVLIVASATDSGDHASADIIPPCR